jgi:hypothetical protein
MRNLIATILLGLFCATAVGEDAPDPSKGRWYVQVGAYTHYSDSEEYEEAPLFGGVEHQNERRTITGFSVFNNSFGDFAQYLYLGKEFRPWQKHPGFRFKLTVGVVHGYEGKHQEIFPIRWGDSWGIGAVPTMGYQWKRLGLDLALLGNSGILFLVGNEF